MATRKEIIFSAKDTGVADTMAKLRQQSEELGRGLIRDARDYTSSGKEAVKYIEDQIKAMERKVALHQKEQKFRADSQRQQALEGASPRERQRIDQQYKSKLTDIGTENREDQMQIALLRELIETIKVKAREGIAADRQNITEQVAKDESLAQLGIKEDEDEFQALEKTIQRETIGTTAKTEREESVNIRDAAKKAEKVSTRSAQALTRPNEIYALGGLLGMIPIVGAGLAMLANKALGEAEGRADARASASSQAGLAMSGIGGSHHGLTQAAVLSRFGGAQANETARALAMRGVMSEGLMSHGAQSGMKDAMNLEMGHGISRGVLEGLAGFGGYHTGGVTSGTRHQSMGGMFFDDLTRAMSKTGLLGASGQQGQNMEAIGQSANQIFGQLSQSLERFDMRQVMAGMSGLTSLGGSFADPDQMGQRYLQLQGGLTDTGNPYTQALKFNTLMGMPGSQGKSRFELMEQQEKGMTEPGFMRGYLQQLHDMSGGNKDIMMEEVKGAFSSLSFDQTRSVVEGFMENPQAFDMNFDQFKGNKALADKQYAETLAVSTAEWADMFADAGDGIIYATNAVTDGIKSLVDAIANL